MERQRIARLLPEIFQRTLPAQWWQDPAPGVSRPRSVLGTFLAVMESLHAPTESALEHLDSYFDPRQAPEDWLPILAQWLDLDRFLTMSGEFPGGPQRLRQLILAAVSLSQERGTLAGFQRFLQIATGVSGIEITTTARRPYHITVSCPAPELQAYGMTDHQFCSWLTELVEAEKPAYVTCDIEVELQTGEPPG